MEFKLITFFSTKTNRPFYVNISDMSDSISGFIPITILKRLFWVSINKNYFYI